MIQNIYKSLLKFVLNLHSFFYATASGLAVRAEGGLHPKHHLMNYHKFFLDNINLGDEVLDIGCGNGSLCLDLSQKAKKVIGIDFDERNINIAKKKYSALNLEYIHGDALKNLPVDRVDAIVLSNVLEHIENRTAFLNKIKNHGSKILIRVPMINRDWITLYKKELGLEWRLDKNHFIEYTLESFQEEIKKAGLKIRNYTIQFGEIWAVITN